MNLARRLLAEGLGTALLTASVVGSGVMAERLAMGNDAIALLANTGATVAALAVLIALLSPVSGAHFNPVVSLAMAIIGRHGTRDMGAYAMVQIAGAITGALLVHAMFSLPLLQISTNMRSGPAMWLSEVVATCGLLLVVMGHRRSEDAPWMVAGWIGAAYWFTASTSFANPAVAIARSLTDTFTGIRPADVPGFIGAELVGMMLALALGRLLFAAPETVRTSRIEVGENQAQELQRSGRQDQP